jgi:hypothetical protein
MCFTPAAGEARIGSRVWYPYCRPCLDVLAESGEEIRLFADMQPDPLAALAGRVQNKLDVSLETWRVYEPEEAAYATGFKHACREVLDLIKEMQT